jgi:predicted phage terminase large subunit-like protein
MSSQRSGRKRLRTKRPRASATDFDQKHVILAAIKACDRLNRVKTGELVQSVEDDEGDKELVRVASHHSLYFFAKHVLGFSRLTDATHKRWADDLQATWYREGNVGKLKPRATYKTTLYAEAFILWVWATQSAKIRFFYTSANSLLIDEVSAHLGHYIAFESESLYASVFGIRRDKYAEKNTQYIFNIVGRESEAKGSSLVMRTAGGSINGVHPHIIIIDDPMDLEDRESEAVREKKNRWSDSLEPLLVPFEHPTLGTISKIFLISTRWHMQDLAAHLMKKVEDWTFEVEGVYKKDGSLQYPEFFTEEMINKKRRNIDSVFFACQYLNDPLPEGCRIYEIDKLHFMRVEQCDITRGTNYCFLDPSLGKKASDFPACIFVNLLNGHKFFFDIIDVKMNLTPLIGLIAKKNKEYRVRQLIFETNGTMGMENNLYRAHQDVGHNISVEGIHETRNKVERITAMQPDLYRSDNYLFRDDWETAYPEAMKQIIFFPAWGKDDFPDVIEKAVTWLIQFEPIDTAKLPPPRTLSGSGGTLSGSLRS